nr:retrovirus-related Pol polyprotein from transposon TNT 1-94 [Tanacetum cinerariifolium]
MGRFVSTFSDLWLERTILNKGLVAETSDWDEEEVFDDEEMTQVKVLMALANEDLDIGKNHARNGEWIDITMKKVNILLFMDKDACPPHQGGTARCNILINITQGDR